MRAGDNQHRHRVLDSIRGVTERQPDDEGDDARSGRKIEQQGSGTIGERLSS
jgi:hypothetical protein